MVQVSRMNGAHSVTDTREMNELSDHGFDKKKRTSKKVRYGSQRWIAGIVCAWTQRQHNIITQELLDSVKYRSQNNSAQSSAKS